MNGRKEMNYHRLITARERKREPPLMLSSTTNLEDDNVDEFSMVRIITCSHVKHSASLIFAHLTFQP